MLEKAVIDLLNEQVNKEFYSAYLYLAFSNYYTEQGLNGFANWYMVQAQEERDHALLFIKYLQNNSVPVVLEAVEKPKAELKDNMAPLEQALAHEKFVTSSIHNIYDKAYQAKDFRTMQFLDWFVSEQAEEETSAEELIQKMKLFGSDAQGLYLLNNELAGRTYSAPSLIL